MHTNYLTINQLQRSFRGRGLVLRDINLRFQNGITALLGPNGSGKTTLLRCLAGIIPYSKGAISWNGTEVRKAGVQYRQCLGYLPQDFAGHQHMSVREFLGYMAALKLLPAELVPARITSLMLELGLSAQAGTPLRQLSGGTLQRVGMAQALLNDPDLLLLDEPTTGMDPEERSNLIELLRSLARERVIIFATHIASDAEAVADSAVVLREGSVLLHQPVLDLRESVAGRVWNVRLRDLSQLPPGCILTRSLPSDAGGIDVRLVCRKQPSSSALPCQPSLEDAYLAAVTHGDGSAAPTPFHKNH